MEDRELVKKLLAKDLAAERYFFNLYRDRLYKACVYLLGYQDSEAEDVVQEAFIVALQKLPGFEFRSTLHHWLFRVCMNLCYRRIRKRGRQIAHVEEELEGLSESLAVEQDDRRMEEEEKGKMIQILRQQRELLGDPCRGLLRMRDEENNSYIAIAESLKIPLGTVMSRLSRCKEALKELILRALREESRV